jgi:hypothetical protein
MLPFTPFATAQTYQMILPRAIAEAQTLPSPRSAIAKRLLRRLARKHNLATRVRQNNPTGKSLKNLSSPSAKNIPLSPSSKSLA